MYRASLNNTSRNFGSASSYYKIHAFCIKFDCITLDWCKKYYFCFAWKNVLQVNEEVATEDAATEDKVSKEDKVEQGNVEMEEVEQQNEVCFYNK